MKSKVKAKPEETTEEHMRRLGCFSPSEIEALLKVEANHEKIDQLAENKGVEPQSGAEVSEPAPESAVTEPPDEGKGFGDYLCPQCKVTHRAGSKVHKRHLKLL